MKYMVDKGELRLAINRVIDTMEGEWIDLIHCADCKWFQCNMPPDGMLPKGVDEYECRHWCGSCDPFDFCSYGERLNLNE